MAERKKQPLSLNDRHNRLLQDLSASQPRPHSKPPSSVPLPPPPAAAEEMKPSMVKLQGRRRLCKASSRDDEDDDVPQFSGITDFDSPSPDFKPSKIELESSGVSPRSDDDYNITNKPKFEESEFSNTTDSPPHPTEEKPQKLRSEERFVSKDSIDDYDITYKPKFEESEFSKTIDSLHHPTEEKPQKLESEEILLPNDPIDDTEEKKPAKVKIEGRRRLCKVSPKDDNTDNDANKKIAHDDPKLSGISDFDSPTQSKNVTAGGNAGGGDIRDILNDLSSRLEYLSIEKKRVPKTVDLKRDPYGIVTDKQTNKVDVPEYSSATSSFSLTPAAVDSELETINCSRTNKVQRTVETKMGGEESVLLGKPLNIDVQVQEEEDNDDCVLLSGKTCHKEMERQHPNFQDKFDNTTKVDSLDESVSEDGSITLNGPKGTYRLPAKIGKMLYPHQRDGMKWLWSLHCKGKGGILGDDMGLGKTMQICGYLAGLFHSSLIKRVLVVAPKTLLPHWIKELSAVGLSAKTKEYFGTCSKARQYELQFVLQDKGILLTTYDIVRNNAKSLSGDNYFNEDELTWDYMILDEGHLIKNPTTQRAKSLLQIPCAHRIIISGTPIQNTLKELWALFSFCCPELLGDKNWFKERYETAIIRGSDKNASDRDKRISSAVAKELREHIQPYFLRRLKSEVFCEDNATNTAKLSKKNEIIVWLRLTRCQRQLYEAFLKSELVLSAFDGSPLAAITILKKICDHPLLLTKRAAEDVLEGLDSMLNQEDHGVAEKLAMHIADVAERYDFKEQHDDVSCKISFILSLLGNLIPDGHNVLIFSQTRKMLNLIQDSLTSRGYKFLRIDGTTKASDRLKVVNDFQEGNCAPIFLLTSQVGGLGLTLTKADRVIVVDPAWNPSTDNQSVDRAYRIGQKKDVLVYRLMTCGTIEEKIYRKQIFKGGLFKTATEHKEQTRYFSQQDLSELFSLPKEGFDVSPTQYQLFQEHDHQHIMDGKLQAHMKFLETLGTAGVSHHSLLFSKTAPVPVVTEDEEDNGARRPTTFMGRGSSSSSLEHNGDGSEFAFNPKDMKLNRKGGYSPKSPSEPTEADIIEKINRLSHILADKGTIGKLPDKGERIQRQIGELNMQLRNITKQVIDLDDLSTDLKRRVVLNV